jgi:hypothetical protein
MTKWSSISKQDGVDYSDLLNKLRSSRKVVATSSVSGGGASSSNGLLSTLKNRWYIAVGTIACIALAGGGYLWYRKRKSNRRFPNVSEFRDSRLPLLPSVPPSQRNEAQQPPDQLPAGQHPQQPAGPADEPRIKKVWVHLIIFGGLLGVAALIWFKFSGKRIQSNLEAVIE